VAVSAGTPPHSPPAKRLALWSSVAVVAAILVVAIVLAAVGPHGASRPGGYQSPCGGAPSQPCAIAADGANWTLTPPASWCTVVSDPGSSGTDWKCSAIAAELSFDPTAEAEVLGSISVSGASHLWLIPSAMVCEQLWSLVPDPVVSCAPPFGPVPPYAWNESFPAASNISLFTLSFNFTGDPGLLPAGVALALVIVDDGSANETATATTPIALSGLPAP
jgi:hypothetical protein